MSLVHKLVLNLLMLNILFSGIVINQCTLKISLIYPEEGISQKANLVFQIKLLVLIFNKKPYSQKSSFYLSHALFIGLKHVVSTYFDKLTKNLNEVNNELEYSCIKTND